MKFKAVVVYCGYGEFSLNERMDVISISSGVSFDEMVRDYYEGVTSPADEFVGMVVLDDIAFGEWGEENCLLMIGEGHYLYNNVIVGEGGLDEYIGDEVVWKQMWGDGMIGSHDKDVIVDIMEEEVKKRRTTSWKYRIGDVVKHVEYDNLYGVIVDVKNDYEVDLDMDDNQPWYVIRWVKQVGYNEMEFSNGQEHEVQLELVDQYVRVDTCGV